MRAGVPSWILNLERVVRLISQQCGYNQPATGGWFEWRFEQKLPVNLGAAPAGQCDQNMSSPGFQMRLL